MMIHGETVGTEPPRNVTEVQEIAWRNNLSLFKIIISERNTKFLSYDAQQ